MVKPCSKYGNNASDRLNFSKKTPQNAIMATLFSLPDHLKFTPVYPAAQPNSASFAQF